MWYIRYNKFHHVIQWANIHVSAHVLGRTNTALTIKYSAYWVKSMLTTEREVILKVPCGVSDHKQRSGVMFLWVFPPVCFFMTEVLSRERHITSLYSNGPFLKQWQLMEPLNSSQKSSANTSSPVLPNIALLSLFIHAFILPAKNFLELS